ncbi:GntR family transcriptional regulator [Desulfospira joergensenii]|uniref:GntR family transcriptional regulator n=1 Tax=Desulfospira joergensenii TaxID=53329 RepID=UPI0003B676FF|nr:GntR family transcriptional regulator [Desulfospira joergensenii]
MARKNLDEFAYKKIIELILKDQFSPGEFILETELSEELGLSRTPVRHALGQLVAEGFLDKKKKKGCFIPLPSPQDAKHVFHVREHLEGLAAATAADCATAEDIDFLFDLIEREKALGSLKNDDVKITSLSLNEEFHMGIARMSRNPYIEQYCRHSFWRSHTYICFFDRDYMGLNPGPQLIGPRQHIDIVRAIEKKDSSEAGEQMRTHVRTTFEKLFGRLNL